jgi:hypothetical protein
MQQSTRVGVSASVACALVAAWPTAAGPVELDFLLFEIDYGVLADGGGSPPPLQGPLTVGEGKEDLAWSQVDGVASAMATASTLLSVSGSESGLRLAGSLHSSAAVEVGDDPEFAFEYAQAEVYLNQLLISITVSEESVVTALHAPVNLEGVGMIEVGGTEVLAPGMYDFEYAGGYATGVQVWAQANESAFETNAWSFGLDVAVVPAPGGAAVMMVLLAGIRRCR